VGNGDKIHFWTDKWLDTVIATHWSNPQTVSSSLSMKVSACISNGVWCLPGYLVDKDPALATQICQVTLPTEAMPDMLCWESAPDGILTSKIAFRTLNGVGQRSTWANILWNSHIPPSRSFITWRLLHNKLPTDENLRKRGCTIVSICCFCLQESESSHHIFFDCPVTSRLWEWLGKGTNQHLDCTNCLQLLLGGMGTRSKLVQQLLHSAIIHAIWVIWIERNHRYYHDKKQAMTTLFNIILTEVKLSYSLSLVKGSSDMLDYHVTKLFNIPLKVKRITPTHETAWKPPFPGVIKINCDGSAVGSQPCGAIGIVLKDSDCNFQGALYSNIGYATSLEAEFSACMLAIEKAQHLGLTNICLETDYAQVVNAFNKEIGVPWQMRSRWHNCIQFCSGISCSCVHTLWEGNMVAYALAKNGQGLSCYSTQWWPSPPPFIHSLLYRDRLGLPFSRLALF